MPENGIWINVSMCVVQHAVTELSITEHKDTVVLVLNRVMRRRTNVPQYKQLASFSMSMNNCHCNGSWYYGTQLIHSKFNSIIHLTNTLIQLVLKNYNDGMFYCIHIKHSVEQLLEKPANPGSPGKQPLKPRWWAGSDIIDHYHSLHSNMAC